MQGSKIKKMIPITEVLMRMIQCAMQSYIFYPQLF